MAYTRKWDAAYEESPDTNYDSVGAGAQNIRQVKIDIRERMEKDHYMDTSGTDADHGEHKKITFHEAMDTPDAVTGKSFVYPKTIDGGMELCYLDDSGNEVQITSDGGVDMSALRGIIVMWSGAVADIPSGWHLCDGTEGTPDLRDRFIVGAGDSYSVGDTGGSATMEHTHGTADTAQANLYIDEVVRHRHTINDPTVSPVGGGGGYSNYASIGTTYTGYTGEDTVNVKGVTDGASNTENRPPYYSLAYIMKL